MKKAISILIILIVLATAGGVVWWFFLRKPTAYKAEDILPANTIALLQIPNMDEARTRWKQSPAGRIWAEPEVQAFVGQPLATLKAELAKKPKTEEAQKYFHWLEDLFSNFHGEAFVGFLGFDLSPRLQLQLVFGFDAGPNAAEAQKTVEAMAADLRDNFPKGVREEKEHLGIAYETWSPASGLIFCHARLGNLFLFTTDEPSLQVCIDLAKGERDNPLRSDGVFTRSLAKVEGKGDALVYLNLQPVLGKFGPLLAMMAAGGSPLKDLGAFKAVTMSTQFEPTGPVDRMFVYVPEAGRPAALSIDAPWERKSVPLVSSQAVFYGIKSFDMARYYDDLVTQAMAAAGATGVAQGYDQFNALLAANGVNLRPDLIGKLGKEFALWIEWSDTDQFPQVYIMLESTDTPGLIGSIQKLLSLASTMAAAGAQAGGPPPPVPGTMEVAGKTIHKYLVEPKHGLGLFFTDAEPFVVLSFQENALPSYVDRIAKKQIVGFDANAVYKQTAPGMPASVNTFLYADNKPVFEKVYNFVAPLAMLGSAMMPEQKAVDFSKLPKAETIARHLSPSVSYQYMDAEGMFRYSSGPFPPETPFILAGFGAGIASAGYAEAQKQQQAAQVPAPVQPLAQTPPATTTNAQPAAPSLVLTNSQPATVPTP